MSLPLVAALEFAVWVGIVPLLACALATSRVPVTRDAWWIAGTLGVAFVASVVQRNLALHGVNNWGVTYAYPPLLFGLLLWRLLDTQAKRLAAIGGVLLLASLSVSQAHAHGTLDKPEAIVSIGAGLLVAWIADKAPRFAPYRSALLVYSAGAAPFLWAVSVQDAGYSVGWQVAFWGYQAVRVIGIGLFVRAVMHVAPPRLEVVDGAGSPRETVDRGRRSLWTAGRHSAPQPARAIQ